MSIQLESVSKKIKTDIVVAQDPININCLPDEIQFKILSFLSSLHTETINAKLCCWKWNQIISDPFFLISQMESTKSLNSPQITKWHEAFLRYNIPLNIDQIMQKFKNLEELTLFDIAISDEHLIDIQKHLPKKIQKLSFQNCPNLVLPNFNQLTKLQYLTLSECPNLTAPIFQNMPSVINIDVVCASLQKLTFINLTALKNIVFANTLTEMSFSNCRLSHLKFDKASSTVKKLSVTNSNFLKEIRLSDFEFLETIYVSYCTILNNVKIEKCNALKFLTLDVSQSLHLNSFEISECASILDVNLQGLPFKEITIKKCDNLIRYYLQSNTQLKKLKIKKCPSLYRMDFSDKMLSCLQTLKFADCKNLSDVKLKGLSNLIYLDLSNTAIEVFNFFQNELPSIKSINLSRNAHLKHAAFYGNKHITSLNLSDCTNLQTFKKNEIHFSNIFISELNFSYQILNELISPFLKQKKMLDTKELLDIQEVMLEQYEDKFPLHVMLHFAPHLHTLDLSNSNVDDLLFETMEKLKYPSITCLKLDNCLNITSPNFSAFPNLRVLSLKNCLNVSDPLVENNKKLQELHLQNCPLLYNLKVDELTSLSKVHFEGGYTHLKEFSAVGCSSLTSIDFPSVSFFVNKLNFSNCKNLKSLNFLKIQFLKELTLTGCVKLEKMTIHTTSPLEELELKDLPSLKFLSLNCSGLKKLNLKNLPFIEQIDLSNTFLSQLDFSQTPQLKSLKLFHNINLVSVHFQNSRLEDLTITESLSLKKFVCNSPKLKKVLINQCHYLKKLNFDDAKEIEKIYIIENPMLEELSILNIGDGLKELQFDPRRVKILTEKLYVKRMIPEKGAT